MTVVHWARHGENAANLSRRFSHRIYDGDLTGRGVAQAEQLAADLRTAGHSYGLLVTSPLRRARQTAQVVSDRLELPISLELEDLREVNVGELDGRNDATSWQVYDAILSGWRRDELDQRFPGGESGRELAARIRRALLTVTDRADRAGSEHAIVIAHGANIRAALPALTGQPDPGTDLGTGACAALSVSPGADPSIALTGWASASQ